MLDKRELRQDELEKVSGGRRETSYYWRVVYTTDGSDTPYERRVLVNGQWVKQTNTGYASLGKCDDYNQAYDAGLTYCTQNNVHFIRVEIF